jgi:quinol monooxygenase YgiN
MNENVNWVIELAVNPGRSEDLKTLVAELIEVNRNKVGFLTQEVAISDDQQVCHIFGRFQDSAAITNHMQSSVRSFPSDFSKY